MLFFLILSINLLSNANKVNIKIINEIGSELEGVKGIYRESKEDKETIIDGKATLFLKDDIKLIKLYKKGYVDKGFILAKGKNIIKMEPKKASLQGNISGKSIILRNILIELTDEKGKVLLKTKSDKKGFFKFKDLPILRNYYLKVIYEGFIPYISEIINLREKDKYIKNIYLKTSEIFFIFDINYQNGKVGSKIKVTLEDIEKETDKNGIVVFRIASSRKKNLNIRVLSHKLNIDLDVNKKYISHTITIPT